MPSQSFADMRRRNASKILAAVREHPHISRADVARHTRLARATVSSIVDDLIAMGLLRETGSKEAAKGRRPIGLTFNADAGVCCGISIERERLDFCLTDMDGNIKRDISRKSNTCLTIPELSSLLRSGLNEILSADNMSFEKLACIGLAVPGPLHEDGLSVLLESKVLQLDYRVLRDELQESLGRQVFLDTNLNMYAMAQTKTGLLPSDSKSVLIIRAGHLIRSALIVEGRVFEGRSNKGGELGHVKLPEGRQQCFCGAKGCLNAIASTAALLDRSRQVDKEITSLEELVRKCEGESESLRAVIREAGNAIGYGVSVALNLLAPDVVLVSARHLADSEDFTEAVISEAKRNTPSVNFDNSTLIISKSNMHYEAYGAATAALSSHDLFSAVELEQQKVIIS